MNFNSTHFIISLEIMTGNKMTEAVLAKYGIEINAAVSSFGSGLINNTWIVHNDENDFILQRINHTVFKNPVAIADNIRQIGEYLAEKHPDYLFVSPCRTIEGEDLVILNGEYFRLFPFVKNSHTTDVVLSPTQAYEAAKQFGRFTSLLSGFGVEKLKNTIPDFHNLKLRYEQFEQACRQGNKERVLESSDLIWFLKTQKEIVTTAQLIGNQEGFKRRVTHHDCKISNVLFDKNDKGLCVIDLDTVMPGFFISDFGDMMRTYLSPVSEEEKDFSKIEIREDYFRAIAEGYLSEMETELSEAEKKHMVYAGKFMIYMQALRFLTDHLNNDIYYGAKYEGHNFIRASNQVVLLEKIYSKEKMLEKIVLG
jgi:Ser/Thr protein kinase RdoA (MazF antagonist)